MRVEIVFYFYFIFLLGKYSYPLKRHKLTSICTHTLHK